MIFSLFKSKKTWQHKDSNIRISAINQELTTDNNEDKAILSSMLNEDINELVRRAVLLKLNSFNEYFNAITTNNNKAIQEFSTTQVQDILAGQHKINLSNDQKQAFLNIITTNQSVDFSLVNTWFEHEKDPALIISLFEVLVKNRNVAQFLLQVFTKKQSVDVQTLLLSLELKELTDTTLLSKLSKKAVNNDIVQLINERLAKQVEQQEKPKRILKQKQLLLSKLLALKEQADYEQYTIKRSSLHSEWQNNLSEIECLSKEEQQTLLTKFTKITEQLTQLFAPKKEAYQQAKITEQLLNDKKIAKADLSKTITDFNQAIITAVFEGNSIDTTNIDGLQIDQQKFAKQLNQLKDKLAVSILNQTEQTEFSQQIAQLNKRLTQLPEIAESVSEATYLISKMSQLTLPQSLSELKDRQQTYYDWVTAWKLVDQKACGVLPQSIKDAHKEIAQIWRDGLKPLEQEQKQLFTQTKKKLFDLKRLLTNGKYKVCFGLFKGVSQVITLLSASQQQQLQRDFDNVSKKMVEISDWEHYIATPRKQELLTEINQLVNAPMDNPNEQADKVKQFRKTWNSLGHADEALDKELNEQFNLACEQAFAPCRMFYAEQEKLREQHLITRQQVLEQASSLAETVNAPDIDNASIDFKALNGKLNKLQQRWQQAGDVDREQYQKLFKQYKNIIQPIQKAIKGFHDANASIKQTLIAQAEQQLALEDVYQAIDDIKKLQQQWQGVGFAGSYQDSKLWQKFRAINDQVFAKRAQVKSAQQTEAEALVAGFNQTLSHIKAGLSGLEKVNIDKSALNHVIEQATELLNQVLTHKPVLKSVVSTIDTFIKQVSQQVEQINVEEEKKNWQNLFSLLEQMAQGDLNISAENMVNNSEHQQLTSFWQKRIIEQNSQTEQADADIRANKTLELEILAKIDSPTELAAQRMAVQVSLMQEQMRSGASIDLSERLVDWLRLGQLTVEDLALITRIKRIFV